MNNPLVSLPGYMLRRASSAMLADLAKRLDRLDLRPSDASILVLIAANPGIKQSELCKILDIQRANMTPLVGKLDQRNLIERRAMDGRSQGLALTEKGSLLAKQALKAMHTHEDYLIARLAPEDRRTLLKALTSLWQQQQ